MNLASALLKQLLASQDFDTWCATRKHYLPNEYHAVYDTIEKHVDLYHSLPTLEELKLAIRDEDTLNKVYSIEAVEVDAEPFLLLEYIKNEFTQKETLFQLQNYVENSISFETANETIDSLYDLVSRIEDMVDLEAAEDNMQKLSLFESDEELESYIPLGLNSDFDDHVRFKSIDYVLIGGRRGAGKSLVCSNIAHRTMLKGKSVLYFTIEMNTREILQRHTSIATQIPHSKLKYKTLDNQEWFRLAQFWSERFENGEKYLEEYKSHRDFNRFHSEISAEKLSEVQLDIVYDPELTLTKFRAEATKRCKKLGNVGLIIVDYVNQVKRTSGGAGDLYDWKDQIYVSKGLKSTAQELEVPVVSPYQIDASGEARFSKGILDSADAAFTLTPGPDYIAFKCSKLRGDQERDFVSRCTWDTLTVGPENGVMQVTEDTSKADKNRTVLGGISDDC